MTKIIEPVVPDVDEDTVLLQPGDLDTVLEEVSTTKKRVFRINRSRMCQDALYDGVGSMCILGHVLNKMGVSTEDLEPRSDPADVALSGIKLSDEAEKLLISKRGMGNSAFANKAIAINDSDGPWEKKGKRLIAHFAKAGYTLTFCGKYNE